MIAWSILWLAAPTLELIFEPELPAPQAAAVRRLRPERRAGWASDSSDRAPQGLH